MEQWTRWAPIENIEGKYFVEAVNFSEDGLLIKLSDENGDKKIEIFFNSNVDAYRYTNDSFSFEIPATLSQKYEKGFYKNWTFFKVAHSDYLSWLAEKSAGYAQNFPFVHYCIMGGDEIVEILSRFEPKVRIITDLKHDE